MTILGVATRNQEVDSQGVSESPMPAGSPRRVIFATYPLGDSEYRRSIGLPETSQPGELCHPVVC